MKKLYNLSLFFIFIILFGVILNIYYKDKGRGGKGEGDQNDYIVLSKLEKEFINFFNNYKNNGNIWEKRLAKLNYINIMDIVQLYIDPRETYIINKKHIFMCLKDPVTKEYYSNDMLKYVLAHEISHAIETTVGHNKEFIQTFDELLHVLKKHNFFSNKNFIPDSKYCNL